MEEAEEEDEKEKEEEEGYCLEGELIIGFLMPPNVCHETDPLLAA